MRYREIICELGLVVPGVNTTPDVGPGEIKRQAAKMGFDVDENGIPPLLMGHTIKANKAIAKKAGQTFYGKNGTPPNKKAPVVEGITGFTPLYHNTRFDNALEIMQTKTIYANKHIHIDGDLTGTHACICTSRNKKFRYVLSPIQFVLNKEKIKHRYKIVPYDYFRGENPRSESEERVLAEKLPISYVEQINFVPYTHRITLDTEIKAWEEIKKIAHSYGIKTSEPRRDPVTESDHTTNYRVLKNPSKKTFAAALRKAGSSHSFRGIWDGTDTFFWDSYYATHHEASEKLGIEYKYDNRLNADYYRPDDCISVEGGQNVPQKIIDYYDER